MAEKKVALAFGSNLGHKEKNISKALDYLQKGGFKISAVSASMKSDPVDCTPGSGIFLNGALTGTWGKNANDLLELCQEIEQRMGRKEVRAINSPRPIDLDILLFDSEVITCESLKVPHPRMLERDFVMLPLDEVASDWLIPGIDKTVHEIAENFR